MVSWALGLAPTDWQNTQEWQWPSWGQDPCLRCYCVPPSSTGTDTALLNVCWTNGLFKKKNKWRCIFWSWQDYFISFFIHMHIFTKQLLCVSGSRGSGATKTCEVFLILAHWRNSFILFYSFIQRGKTTALQQAGSLMYPTKFPGVSSFQAPNDLTHSKQKSLFMYSRRRNL